MHIVVRGTIRLLRSSQFWSTLFCLSRACYRFFLFFLIIPVPMRKLLPPPRKSCTKKNCSPPIFFRENKHPQNIAPFQNSTAKKILSPQKTLWSAENSLSQKPLLEYHNPSPENSLPSLKTFTGIFLPEESHPENSSPKNSPLQKPLSNLPSIPSECPTLNPPLNYFPLKTSYRSKTSPFQKLPPPSKTFPFRKLRFSLWNFLPPGEK